MTRLSGKIAIVTGAGIGIGSAIARRFAAEGAHVWVTDINGESAEETVRDIKGKGGTATAMVVDVSKGQDLTALVRNVEVAHGRADVLVNNAGILVRSEVRQLSDADWDKLREVNVDAILRLSRAGSRRLPAAVLRDAPANGQASGCRRCATARRRLRP